MRVSALLHLANVRWLTKRRLFDGWVGPWTDARQDGREASLLRSIRALGRLRERKAVPALAKALRDFGSTYMRDSVGAAAARALGEIGDPSAIPALREHAFAESPSALVVDAATEALGRIGDEDVARALLDRLLLPDEGTVLLDKVFGTAIAATRRRAAVKALVLMKGIRPDHPRDYEAIPLARLAEGKPLPLQERRSPEAPSEQVLSDFASYIERHFVGDTERATRAIAGRYGLTSGQVERVCERYLASQQTPARPGHAEASNPVRRAPADGGRAGRRE